MEIKKMIEVFKRTRKAMFRELRISENMKLRFGRNDKKLNNHLTGVVPAIAVVSYS